MEAKIANTNLRLGKQCEFENAVEEEETRKVFDQHFVERITWDDDIAVEQRQYPRRVICTIHPRELSPRQVLLQQMVRYRQTMIPLPSVSCFQPRILFTGKCNWKLTDDTQNNTESK